MVILGQPPQYTTLHFVPGETWGARFVRRTDGVKTPWPVGATAAINFPGGTVTAWPGTIDAADPSAIVFTVTESQTTALAASAELKFTLSFNGRTTHYGPIERWEA